MREEDIVPNWGTGQRSRHWRRCFENEVNGEEGMLQSKCFSYSNAAELLPRRTEILEITIYSINPRLPDLLFFFFSILDFAIPLRVLNCKTRLSNH
jgi:hypothetical protein